MNVHIVVFHREVSLVQLVLRPPKQPLIELDFRRKSIVFTDKLYVLADKRLIFADKFLTFADKHAISAD